MEGDLWIKIKIDQIVSQFVAHGQNHESTILFNNNCDCLYAMQLEHTEVSTRALAAIFASKKQNRNNYF